MGWLTKWVKKQNRATVVAVAESIASPAPSSPVRPAVAPTRPADVPPLSHPPRDTFELPGGGRQAVVGESHYQSAIRSAVRGKTVPQAGPEGWALAPAVQATLRPEPNNPYDRWAVAVDLNGRCVGYLPREDAREYHPHIAALAADGIQAVCVGHVVRVDKGLLAVYLRLAPVEDVALAIESRHYADYIGGRRFASMPAAKDWQDPMRSVYTPQLSQPLIAEMRLGVIPKGKNAGLQCIEVFVCDQQIGALTRRMSERYEARVVAATAAGRKAICRLTIASADDGLLRATLLTCDYD